MYCPICKSNRIDFKNIGFVSCQWTYRGILSSKTKENSLISGDGITIIDNKLYILNEVSFNQRLDRLEINIKEKKKPSAHNTCTDSNQNSIPNKEINVSNSNSDLDSIGLDSIDSNIPALDNSANEDDEFFNSEAKINIRKDKININSEPDTNFQNDGHLTPFSNKDSTKKSIFSKNSNNSRYSDGLMVDNNSKNNFENAHSKQSQIFAAEKIKTQINKSVEISFNSFNSNNYINSDNFKSNYNDLNSNKNDHIKEIEIEKSSKCIDQSCLSFCHDKNERDRRNKNSCLIF